MVLVNETRGVGLAGWTIPVGHEMPARLRPPPLKFNEISVFNSLAKHYTSHVTHVVVVFVLHLSLAHEMLWNASGPPPLKSDEILRKALHWVLTRRQKRLTFKLNRGEHWANLCQLKLMFNKLFLTCQIWIYLQASRKGCKQPSFNSLNPLLKRYVASRNVKPCFSFVDLVALNNSTVMGCIGLDYKVSRGV